MIDPLEAGLGTVVERLRRLPEPDPGALLRLRRAVEADGAEPAPGGGLRTVLSPARAAAAAVLLVGLTSLLWIVLLGPRDALPGDAAIPVQFVLAAHDARSVVVVGDFNDWNPAATPLRRGTEGVWSVVVPLSVGRYAYSFVVDGREWRPGGGAAPRLDAFGRPSSVLLVSRPAT